MTEFLQMGLIADIQSDMEKGAVRLISEYRLRLVSDAQRLCENASDVDDLVSRTLVKVINNIDSHDATRDFYAWMKSIMENIHLNDVRRPVDRRTKAVPPEELEQCAGADWSTDEQLLKNSDSEALREALHGLDPKYNQVLLMRYYQEFSMKQIANILQLPLGTVTRRVQIAHQILAGKLRAEFGKMKKPLAILLAALLGVGSLFGAWQAGLVDAIKAAVAGVEEAGKVEKAEELVADVENVEERKSGILSAFNQKDEPSTSVPAQNEEVLSNDNQENTTQQTHETLTREKPTMKLTSTLKSVAAAALTTAALASDGVTIDVTKVQQRYPWNGLVDIDYTITRDQGESALDPAKYSVEITVVNCDETPAVTNVAHVFRQGALPVSDGTHRVTWDANAEGVNFKAQNVKVFAEIVHYAEKYMVIDVSAGPEATVYPVTYLNGLPEGGLNTEEYKGDKIALRLIPPGSFVMGSPTTESGRNAASEVQHAVAITKPFYIGIFQITQKQYANVMDKRPSTDAKDDADRDYHPVETVSYNIIRGTANKSTHQYDWPWTNEVDAASFMGKLRAKCKEWDGVDYTKDVAGLFDLPTDAQWEYACRAGRTSAYNNGGNAEADLRQLGCYRNNRPATFHSVVGSYLPNAWGIYDMHGNVFERCLDWFQEDVQNIESPSVDPVGPDTGSARVTRSGSWNQFASGCRSAYRDGESPTNKGRDYGFRLSRTLP